MREAELFACFDAGLDCFITLWLPEEVYLTNDLSLGRVGLLSVDGIIRSLA